jgi:C-methyltransferase C-terminal domain/Putative zinc binding domain/Methyltransferase domain
MNCRHCNNQLSNVFCDLQTCPPSNAMVSGERLNFPETYFPLKVFVCENCWLVQVEEVEKAADIFNEEYTYFSSYSTSWLDHAKDYVEYMIHRFGFNSSSKIVEIASNDGYLLQYFKKANIPVLGIEPTSNTATVAIERGINCIVDFFGERLAEKEIKNQADLLLGNNVLAHVPDINDFIKGVKIALKYNGVITFEFPHLCKLIESNQFDTIYHEHFSYFSLTSVKTIFEKYGLAIFDVQEIETHGGSLRIFAKHEEDLSKKNEPSVDKLIEQENKLGVNTLQYYRGFQVKIDKIKHDLLQFLLDQKLKNKKTVAYGAAAKGNTLLNYCGIKGSDLISFVVDKSPYKQNKFLPGSRIPVFNEEEIIRNKPDNILIFPWNLSKEISEQLSYTKEWNAKLIVAIPEIKIL